MSSNKPFRCHDLHFDQPFGVLLISHKIHRPLPSSNMKMSLKSIFINHHVEPKLFQNILLPTEQMEIPYLQDNSP